MDRTRRIQWFTVAAILAVVVASGPLVPVDLVGERPDAPDGNAPAVSGNASILVLDEPGPVTLERGRFGAGTYTFSGTGVTLQVDDVSGHPVVGYELSIDALGFTGSRLFFLNRSHAGSTITLSIERGNFPRGDLANESYSGRVTVRVRGAEERVVGVWNVGIEVVA